MRWRGPPTGPIELANADVAHQPAQLFAHPCIWRNMTRRRFAIGSHQVTITPLIEEDGTTRYDLAISAGTRTTLKLYETLESAIDSFDPPLSARVRSHIVEGVRGEGKPVVFCLEDSFT
jgi:hypothetical protein